MNPGKTTLPRSVAGVARRLTAAGFEAYVVGGAVRDLILGRPPKDWDIATNAKPSQVERLFPKTAATGKKYGTITVLRGSAAIQVTTYRTEGGYVRRRRPKSVRFVSDLETDLSRRDFTINAMALDAVHARVVDPFGGAEDLKRGRLAAVGDARRRLSEDALRIVRAARFLSELNLRADASLTSAARKAARHIGELSRERIGEELRKLLLSPRPSLGLRWLNRVGGLRHFLPELQACARFRQGGWHEFDVLDHTLRALDAAPPKLEVRLGLLLHDIAKPLTRTRDRRGYHFYGHERLGAEMARVALKRLRFPGGIVEIAATLIRHHLFDAGPISRSEAAVRRLMQKVGDSLVEDLIDLRRADIRGCGAGRRPDRALAALERRIRKIRKDRDAITLKDLRANGDDVMRWRRIGPGPEVGRVLRSLLNRILRNPRLNTRKDLKTLIVAE